MIQLIKGDCLIENEKIKSGSVDLILTDLPFGTVKNLRSSPASKTTGLKENLWDEIIPINRINEMSNRILRKNGKMILFAQEPFTHELKEKAIPNLPFNYRMIWEKDHFANCLLAKKAPVSYYEDVLVFSKTHEYKNTNPLAEYVKMLQEKKNVFWNNEIAKYYVKKGFSKSFNNAKAVLKHFLNWNYVQFSVFTEQHYKRLKYFFDFDKTYNELKQIDNEHKKQFASTFNLWEGKKYKKDYNGYHPTQKPILLLEDLIKTFSNEGDTVVDLTAGSFSTAIACQNTKRNFIGIEKDENYFNIGKKRIEENKYKLF